jgi:hypothetical protein
MRESCIQGMVSDLLNPSQWSADSNRWACGHSRVRLENVPGRESCYREGVACEQVIVPFPVPHLLKLRSPSRSHLLRFFANECATLAQAIATAQVSSPLPPYLLFWSETSATTAMLLHYRKSPLLLDVLRSLMQGRHESDVIVRSHQPELRSGPDIMESSELLPVESTTVDTTNTPHPMCIY